MYGRADGMPGSHLPCAETPRLSSIVKPEATRDRNSLARIAKSYIRECALGNAKPRAYKSILWSQERRSTTYSVWLAQYTITYC